MSENVAVYQSNTSRIAEGYKERGRNACPSTHSVMGMCDAKNARNAVRVAPVKVLIIVRRGEKMRLLAPLSPPGLFVSIAIAICERSSGEYVSHQW